MYLPVMPIFSLTVMTSGIIHLCVSIRFKCTVFSAHQCAYLVHINQEKSYHYETKLYTPIKKIVQLCLYE